MAIASSGAVSASDIRSEYGLTGAVSFSNLYRGGSNIRTKAGNNNAVNLAASVPTSGTITFGNFRGTAKGFRYTFSSTATDQNASALFGSDYSVNYPKEIVIDSGVELGATSTSEEALEIDSGAVGTITVINNGTISGAGGAVGADGGNAFEAAVACTFINNGTVRAGGGGGGNGGAGQLSSTSLVSGTNYSTSGSTGTITIGAGEYMDFTVRHHQGANSGTAYTSTVNAGVLSLNIPAALSGASGYHIRAASSVTISYSSSGQLEWNTYSAWHNYSAGWGYITGGGSGSRSRGNSNAIAVPTRYSATAQIRTSSMGSKTAYHYGRVQINNGTSSSQTFSISGVSNPTISTANHNTSLAGGAGGTGGVGAGYGQSAGAGGSASSGGGAGGTGGSFGANGTAGANGTGGNGTSGGAGGDYIVGISFVTLTNNGTLQGGTA